MPLGKSKKQRREAKCRRSVRGYRPGEGKSKNKGTRQTAGGPSEYAVPARESQKTKARGKASEVRQKMPFRHGKVKKQRHAAKRRKSSEDAVPARENRKAKARGKMPEVRQRISPRRGKSKKQRSGTKTAKTASKMPEPGPVFLRGC